VSSLVPGTDGTYAFLRQAEYEFAGVILETIAESDVIFVPPVVFRDTGTVRFEAVGESAALSAFHDALAELGELSIERVEPFERPNAPSALTDRQFAALEAAVATGYYEVPREGTVAEIARELDCSKSTAGELVRKAEAAVLRDYVASR
jgi:predicted DNA binding protein